MTRSFGESFLSPCFRRIWHLGSGFSLRCSDRVGIRQMLTAAAGAGLRTNENSASVDFVQSAGYPPERLRGSRAGSAHGIDTSLKTCFHPVWQKPMLPGQSASVSGRWGILRMSPCVQNRGDWHHRHVVCVRETDTFSVFPEFCSLPF